LLGARRVRFPPPPPIIQQGNDIDKLIQHLGADKFVLVGWSYGCLATYAYVRNHGLGKISR
jgi:pimeloyl-ACP methyl ester carboxylesterase